MNIKIEQTNKVFSSWGGLVCLSKAMEKTQLNSYISKFIPSLKSGSARSEQKFKNLALGFCAGAECLDDMNHLSKDEGFNEVCNQKVYTAKSYGDYLRSFSNYHCKKLNHSLIELAYSQRASLFKSDSITIDVDSTSNRQYGKKMEGVATNYAHINCLDTITAFDELGIQYWHNVRPGNTYTSEGCVEMIHDIFSRMPKTASFTDLRRYVRGDSGFCRVDFFNACAAKNAGFVVCMKKNIYSPLLDQVSHWQKENVKKDDRIIFFDGRECEIGETLYKPENSVHVLRVVICRALKARFAHQTPLFSHEDHYDYFALVTNIGEHEKKATDLIEFYRKRGQMENYIKELKYGFDLKHYPCLKLTANRAYGIIAAFAYNYMRFFALKINFNKPQYAKALRLRFIQLPVQIVRHAQQVVFKYMPHHYEEVKRCLNMITHTQLGFLT